jgi:hypothetical protein
MRYTETWRGWRRDVLIVGCGMAVLDGPRPEPNRQGPIAPGCRVWTTEAMHTPLRHTDRLKKLDTPTPLSATRL